MQTWLSSMFYIHSNVVLNLAFCTLLPESLIFLNTTSCLIAFPFLLAVGNVIVSLPFFNLFCQECDRLTYAAGYKNIKN